MKTLDFISFFPVFADKKDSLRKWLSFSRPTAFLHMGAGGTLPPYWIETHGFSKNEVTLGYSAVYHITTFPFASLLHIFRTMDCPSEFCPVNTEK